MVTIRDVAEAAGVSPSTVSYVFSGNKRLPATTVARVRASAATLGYRPHATARALSLGRTNIIGLLANVSLRQPEVDADIFMRFVRSAMFASSEHGYDVLIMGRQGDEVLADTLVDALLVMDVRMQDPRLPLIHGIGKPAVLIGMPENTFGLSAVDLDFAQAAQITVEHLADLGHRSIAVLGSPINGGELSWVARFRTGALAAAAQAGIDVRFHDVQDGVTEFDRWFEQMIAREPETTAIVLHNVQLLDSLLLRSRARGFSIPGDLSVITLAPKERMSVLYPDLTILDLPGQQMLERAVDRVVRELSGEQGGVIEFIEPSLQVRASTGPAPVAGRAFLSSH